MSGASGRAGCDEHVTLRSRSGRAMGALYFLVVLGCDVAGPVTAEHGILRVLGWVAVAVLLYGVLRSWQTVVVTSADSVLVRNPLRTYHLRWSDVSRVAARVASDTDPCIDLQRRRGRRIRCLGTLNMHDDPAVLRFAALAASQGIPVDPAVGAPKPKRTKEAEHAVPVGRQKLWGGLEAPRPVARLRVASWRWKVAAVGPFCAGPAAGFVLVSAIVTIDDTGNADTYTTAQNVVSFAALIVGTACLIACWVVAVRWLRRPDLEATTETVTVYGRHPLALPWSMVTRIVRPSGGPSSEQVSGLVLVNGVFVPIRRLGGLLHPQERWFPDDTPPPEPSPGWSAGGEDGRSVRTGRARDLPRPAVAEGRSAVPRLAALGVLLLPVIVAVFVLFTGYQTGGQSGLAVKGAAVSIGSLEVAAIIGLALWWRTATRTIAVGDGWIAWRSRAARRWRILALADVVSTTDLRWQARPGGLALLRADGTGLRLRPKEVTPGVDDLLHHHLAGPVRPVARDLAPYGAPA